MHNLFTFWCCEQLRLAAVTFSLESMLLLSHSCAPSLLLPSWIHQDILWETAAPFPSWSLCAVKLTASQCHATGKTRSRLTSGALSPTWQPKKKKGGGSEEGRFPGFFPSTVNSCRSLFALSSVHGSNRSSSAYPPAQCSQWGQAGSKGSLLSKHLL